MTLHTILAVQALLGLASAKSLHYTSPGDPKKLISTAIPLGNGRLGATPLGTYGEESVILNLDSLWSGGPFENPKYSGGNPSESIAGELKGIRETIFKDGKGNVDPLLGNDDNYGSYQVLGNLTVSLDLGGLSEASDYSMGLDLQTGVYDSKWKNGDVNFEREAFCSYPDKVCVYHVKSSSDLPAVTIDLQSPQSDPAPKVTCEKNSINLRGQTKGSDGMIFDARATVSANGKDGDFCSDGKIETPKGVKDLFVVIAAGSNYDMTKGNKESSYSFKGSDPASDVSKAAEAASSKSYDDLKSAHTKDFSGIMGKFKLDLPDPKGSAGKSTKDIISDYTRGDGNPFVENLLFDYGRYLLTSSSRSGSLPANLQGRWNEKMKADWSADYHANINLQMNYWLAEQCGLGDQTEPLWTYMKETWVPRGEETAKLMYGGEGWVVHDEMNIFGHTAMKMAAGYANYPVTNAWMAQLIWDHFDYTQDADWYKSVGYPLMKGVAKFWLSQLQEDKNFNDGTWVVNPCNSPEHGDTTFGCTHYQQLILELFEHVLRGWGSSGDSDADFKSKVEDMLNKLDKGVHIGKWGQIQEWKIDSDTQNDNHRHLSELVGWFPGFSIATLHADNKTVLNGVQKTLESRGDGKEDANTGWGKAWRSASWARLNNTDKAYDILKFAIQENFAQNGLSMYSGGEPFQIDANFGVSAAVLGMLVRDLDRAHGDERGQAVLLGPAIPGAWKDGSVSGLRLRGGGSVDFSWDGTGTVNSCKVNKEGRGDGVPELSFVVKGGKDIQC